MIYSIRSVNPSIASMYHLNKLVCIEVTCQAIVIFASINLARITPNEALSGDKRFVKRSVSNVWGPHHIEALEPTICGNYQWPRGAKARVYRSISDSHENGDQDEGEGGIISSHEGFRDELASKRITHGYHTIPKQFPSYVRLEIFNVNNPEKFVLCGGTLMAKDIVITAGHCILPEANAARVIAGFSDITKAHLSGELFSTDSQVAMVYGVCYHQNYIELEKLVNHENFYHDIAVLQLDRKLVWSEKVQPACLIESPPNSTYEFYTIGMGKINSSRPSETLDFLPVEQAGCAPFPDTWNSCYKAKHVGEACQGDSGSGLIAIKGNRQYIAGITSVKRTGSKDVSLSCSLNHNKPMMYADLFKERTEIIKMLQYCYEVID